MRFAYIPRGQYRIGQRIHVLGKEVEIESYSHTGRNVIAHTLPGERYERIVCVCTEEEPIGGIPAHMMC
jgi:hypothetical protein